MSPEAPIFAKKALADANFRRRKENFLAKSRKPGLFSPIFASKRKVDAYNREKRSRRCRRGASVDFPFRSFEAAPNAVSQLCEDSPDENFSRTPFPTRAPRSVFRRRRRDRSVERSGRVEGRRFRDFVEFRARFLLLRDRPGPDLRRAAASAAALLLPAAPAAAILRSAAKVLLSAAATAFRAAASAAAARRPAARRAATGRPASRRPQTGRPPLLTS